MAVREETGPARLSAAPDERRFGAYRGRTCRDADVGSSSARADIPGGGADGQFWEDLHDRLARFVGRPTPLYRADRLTGARVAGAGKGDDHQAEDLAHTGAKINNTMGQGLLCKRMSKRRVIAETGAGQHGVATATAAAARAGPRSTWGRRMCAAALNVVRMKLMGAGDRGGVREPDAQDATNEGVRDWMGSADTTHYIIGSVVGPHPFPAIVRDFQSVIGRECKGQCLRHIGRLPDAIVACVGGGSNAAGIFYPFVDDEKVALVGVEAGGRSSEPGEHAATLSAGAPGVLHGSMSYVLQDQFGQTSPVHSCSAGLDYPGVGPEHASWKEAGRVRTVATDDEALDAFGLLSQREGIIPALETAHAIAEAVRLSAMLAEDQHIVVCCSGRGDKDVDEATRLMAERARG